MKHESLKAVFKKRFSIGAAINDDQVSARRIPEETRLIVSQFNSITPENCLKWETVNPSPGVYDFVQGDRFVEFGRKNGMRIVGHILLDRVQTPEWVFEDSAGKTVDRETLLGRIREYISTVVDRYKGRIDVWHVVNEAIGADGRMQKLKWLEIIGDDYVHKAFEYAHLADPNVELWYNGHDMLTREATESVVRLAESIRDRGGRIDGIGVQAHWGLEHPSSKQIDEGIAVLARTGLKIAMTEMDITVLPRGAGAGELNPYPDALPDGMQDRLARRYGDLFSVFLSHADAIDRVNFWGLHDGQSWLNYYPHPGRSDHPLLFDRALKPKPAFFAVVKAAGNEYFRQS